MEEPKIKPASKPIDQPHEEFIQDQPNRREERGHSSDQARRSQDTADDRVGSRADAADEQFDTDDLAEDIDDDERED